MSDSEITERDTMSEDSKSTRTNSEDSKSSTTDSALSSKKENAGDETPSDDSSSDTSEAKSKLEKETNTVLSLQIGNSMKKQYPAGFLKNGLIQGISYQLKLLTWTAWNLYTGTERNWELAAELVDARGFHDLVVKYNTKTDSKEQKSTPKYRFVQVKHTSLKHSIDENHLSSRDKFDRQYSLVYLFTAYLDILQSFKDDQIIDLTLFTNKNIRVYPFLVPIKKDTICSFKKKGQRYNINIDVLDPHSKIMRCLRKVRNDDVLIKNFLRKLVFAVNQPTESELEELIVNNILKTIDFKSMALVYYMFLFKSIYDWFLVYNTKHKTSPYYTRDHMFKSFNTMDRAVQKIVEVKSPKNLLDRFF